LHNQKNDCIFALLKNSKMTSFHSKKLSGLGINVIARALQVCHSSEAIPLPVFNLHE
jgi:hypothetical protein